MKRTFEDQEQWIDALYTTVDDGRQLAEIEQNKIEELFGDEPDALERLEAVEKERQDDSNRYVKYDVDSEDEIVENVPRKKLRLVEPMDLGAFQSARDNLENFFRKKQAPEEPVTHAPKDDLKWSLSAEEKAATKDRLSSLFAPKKPVTHAPKDKDEDLRWSMSEEERAATKDKLAKLFGGTPKKGGKRIQKKKKKTTTTKRRKLTAKQLRLLLS